MKKKSSKQNRRAFVKKSAFLSSTLAITPFMPVSANTPSSPINDDLNMYMIGPRKGYTPRVGTLLSTMTMMRHWIVEGVKNLTQEELDFQIDEKSNSIGAMLWHLAATERYYQLNTFEGMAWGTWSAEIKKEWDVPMSLGEEGRKQIKGYEIDFYLSKLAEVRKATEEGFAKRDDEWLNESVIFFDNQPTNNHCKWFHVCEHESNHNGQIKFIKKRFPK